MRPIVLATSLALIALASTACGNTYHPEYHPVNVSTFSQDLSYPVVVQNGGNPAERSPVYVMPAPMPAPLPAR